MYSEVEEKMFSANGRPLAVLSSYNIHPEMGSENEVGWRFTKLYVDMGYKVIVLTGSLVAAEWEELPSDYRQHIQLKRVDIRILLRIGAKLKIPTQLSYYYWQIKLGLLVKKLVPVGDVVVCQHITWVKASAPNFLWRIGAPYIWGPIGGLERIPKSLLKQHSVKSRLREWVRDLIVVMSQFDPFVKLTAKKADKIIAVNQQTSDELVRFFDVSQKVHIIPAIGVGDIWGELEDQPRQLDEAGELDLNLVTVARLIEWKGFDVLFEALRHLERPWTLKIFGDGPDKVRVNELAEDLVKQGKVKFLGNCARAEVMSAMAGADCMALCSLRDSGGGVYVEAAQLGVPCLAVALGGPQSFLEEISNAILIEVKGKSREEVINDVRSALEGISKSKKHRGSTIDPSSALNFSAKKDLLKALHEEINV